MMNVVFVNENTLGHASYLLPYVRGFKADGRHGVEPLLINATPLPPNLQRWAHFHVRGLRKWGLDFGNLRWRLIVSHYVRQQVKAALAQAPVGAIVVNTQSVGLALTSLAGATPLLVCLDATFAQLARSPWFAPNAPSRWFSSLTLGTLRRRERGLFRSARRLLPWSEPARQSLVQDYGIAPEKASLLPPAIELPPPRPAAWNPKPRPQLLFVGGDFKRKGGPLLLECHRRHLAATCDLHIVTQSAVAPEQGVTIHRSVLASSPEWRHLWEQADLFVFPSTLETFGIVLLEALAFEVPVVATDAGAARWILAEGQAGVLLTNPDASALARAIAQVLDDPVATQARVRRGREQLQRHFELSANLARLAGWLRSP